MKIKIICPKCNTTFLIDSKFSGKKVKCKKCGFILTVPEIIFSSEEKGLKIDTSKNESKLHDKDFESEIKKNASHSQSGVQNKNKKKLIFLTNIFPIILLLLAIISLIFEALNYSSFYSDSGKIGEVFGNRLARSLIIALVLYFPWKKQIKKKKLTFLFLFSLIFLIISGYRHINIYKLNKLSKENRDAQTLFKDFESDIKSIVKNKDENTQILKREDYGELTEYSKILKTFYYEIKYKM